MNLDGMKVVSLALSYATQLGLTKTMAEDLATNQWMINKVTAMEGDEMQVR